MIFLRSLFAAVLSGLVFIYPLTATAQVGNAMDSYIGNVKGYATNSGAGHYKGQQQNVYTLGAFSFRQEQQSVQLAAAQLPSVKTGCGGIDVFKGAFSLISGDQLVAMARNIMQNATTYAFGLALKALTPLIKDEIEVLQELVTKVNAQNYNSCQIAMAGVDSLASKVAQSAGITCEQVGANMGRYSDSMKARMDGCDTKAVANALPDDEKNQMIVDKNYGWIASGEVGPYVDDNQMRELMMSLSGTVVLTAKGNADEGFEFIFFPPKALDDGAIEVLMSGGELNVYRCDDTSSTNTKCLAPSRSGSTMVIPQAKAFRTFTDNAVQGIYDKVTGVSNQPITAAEQNFIDNTTIPLLKAVDVYSAAMPVSGRQAILSFSDLVAYDMVLQFIIRLNQNVLDGTATVTGAEGLSFDNFRAQLLDVKTELYAKRTSLEQRIISSIALIEYLEDMDARTAARYLNSTSGSDTQLSGTKG
jgi:conjugative transfer pilus assembly protein TraH